MRLHGPRSLIAFGALLSLSCAQATVPPSGLGDAGADLSGSTDDAFVMPKKDGGSTDLAKAPIDFAGIDLAQNLDAIMSPDLSGGGALSAADRCTSAPALVPGMTYGNQDTTPLVDDYDVTSTLIGGACFLPFYLYTYPGRDGAYQVVVPAKKTLTITLTVDPSTSWDPMIAIVSSCTLAGFTCLGGADGITNTEVASWQNTDQTQAATVFVIVDSYLTTEFGKYSIRADLN